jgi:dihydroorotate dehydrogenase
MYSAVFQVLKRLDPELTHYWGMAVIRLAGWGPIRGLLRRRTTPNSVLAVSSLGLHFASPIGLAAGFDKNAHAILGMQALGFTHVEVGTVTAHPQPGNPKPRLFRLPEDEALLNRMGFNNDGAQKVAKRLQALRRRHRDLPVIGVNIGKSRMTPLADAVADYVTSTQALAPLADYVVVNVSSPNTPGLRGLQDEKSLRPLLKAVLKEAGGTPVLVKIAPDLSDEAVVGLCALVADVGLQGVIATNTTISREGLTTEPKRVADMGEGGLSGRPLRQRSLEILRLIRQSLPRDMCVISVGGVFTGIHVQERLDAGATLVQAYTGFVYRGPLFAHHLTKELTADKGF